MTTPAPRPVVVLPHPDRIVTTARTVTAGHGMGAEHADRLAAALAYLLVRFAGMACTGELPALDHADRSLVAGRPIPALSVIGQYRRESAALLTGRTSPLPEWPS